MSDSRDWYCGQAPGTAMERLQAETEAAYRIDDESHTRTRFVTAPLTTPRTRKIEWDLPDRKPDPELARQKKEALRQRLAERKAIWGRLAVIASGKHEDRDPLDPYWIRLEVCESTQRPIDDAEVARMVDLTLFARRFDRWAEEGFPLKGEV